MEIYSGGGVSRQEFWTSLHNNISAKLKYPLPAFILTEKEYKSIMYPAIRVDLPKSGIISDIVTEVRDGHSKSGGAEVTSTCIYNIVTFSRITYIYQPEREIIS